MRTLLISVLLTLAASPALAQSYGRAIAQAPERYDEPADLRDGGYGRGDDRAADRGRYDAYEPRYQPPPARHRHRSTPAPVSRYAGFGNPVYYDDGMIRTGRDYPAGTVGLAPASQAQPQVCTVRRSYYDAHQGRDRVVRRRVPCAGQGRYEEE